MISQGLGTVFEFRLPDFNLITSKEAISWAKSFINRPRDPWGRAARAWAADSGGVKGVTVNNAAPASDKFELTQIA
jgi:hypothetical protein